MKTWGFYDARQKDMDIGFKNNLHPALIVDVHITMWIMIWLFNYMISNSLGSKLKKKMQIIAKLDITPCRSKPKR